MRTIHTTQDGTVDAGSVDELVERGRLTTKVGSVPVVVFWHDDRPWAVEDRCPHLGFPLHQGTVGQGMVTCHWHHARFDLSSGCTFDPWADDVRAFPVHVDGGRVMVSPGDNSVRTDVLRRRLREGLEENLTLVLAKSTLGLLDAGVAPAEIVSIGARFGLENRRGGWGAGLTVLTAMANIVDDLDADTRPLALLQGLRFVANDTEGHPTRFPLSPMSGSTADGEQLASWYRSLVDSRSADAAERALATAASGGASPEQVEAMLFAAATDHVFVDEGHTVDFVNKALELMAHVGRDEAPLVLSSLVGQMAAASRSEELSAWRHPVDLTALIAEHVEMVGKAMQNRDRLAAPEFAVRGLADGLLADDAADVMAAMAAAVDAGATPEELGRAVAMAAALRIVRFHTASDHQDWNVVHHGFTTANATHQALARHPTPELLRGVLHGAMKVHLDRFLNVPAARLPSGQSGSLAELAECWDEQGHVDRAGELAWGYQVQGGDPAALVAALGRGLLSEDAGFHWFQLYEAAVQQWRAWPPDSDEARLVLVAAARFLAAHTPTRRERSRVVDIARRLRRGEALYEDVGAAG
jgi:nitrite reductase/ring-hydroxylating ferredoxin subunit